MTTNPEEFFFKDFKEFRKYYPELMKSGSTNSKKNDTNDDDQECHHCDMNVHIVPLGNISGIGDIFKQFFENMDPMIKFNFAVKEHEHMSLKKISKGKMKNASEKEKERINKLPKYLRILGVYDPSAMELIGPFIAGKCSYKKMLEKVLQYLIVKYVETDKEKYEFGKVVSKLQNEWPN